MYKTLGIIFKVKFLFYCRNPTKLNSTQSWVEQELLRPLHDCVMCTSGYCTLHHNLFMDIISLSIKTFSSCLLLQISVALSPHTHFLVLSHMEQYLVLSDNVDLQVDNIINVLVFHKRLVNISIQQVEI